MHDRAQAELRTDEQNQKLIEIIESVPNGNQRDWAYSDVQNTGEDVTLILVALKEYEQNPEWTIRADGTLVE